MKIFLHNTCLGIMERQFTIDAALSIEPTNYANNETAEQPHLLKRFALVQATALDRSNMIGVGPLITIPLLMSTLGGPQGKAQGHKQGCQKATTAIEKNLRLCRLMCGRSL